MSRLTKLFYLIVIVFLFFYLTAGKKLIKSFSETKKDYEYLSLFSEIALKTQTEYFEDIKPGEKFPGAYTAMLGHLDNVSAYLSARQTRIYDLYQRGTFYSSGIFGAKLSNYFYVSDIIKDSPADKAGLRPGDIIKSVRGKSIFSLPFYQMYFPLVSSKPENFEISVYKKVSKKTVNVHLQTRLLESKTQIREITNNILLVKIPKMNKQSAAYLSENLRNKRHHLKLIIDLRNYCGGDFESFLEVAKIFFKESANVTLTLKKKKLEEDFPIGSQNKPDYQAVVIVNKSTVMYGELLAALFKTTNQNKNNKITIIGRKTPGLISKLKHIKFEDGSSILLSEGFFLINDKKAAKSGVKPHIELKEKEFDSIINRSKVILNER